jgi:hypothetical protein
VLHDWLDARQGSPLDSGEFEGFRRIVASITLTLRELPELDSLIVKASSNALTLTDLQLGDILE